MARSSAAGNTYYRVVVNHESSNGRKWYEFLGPYATIGVAKSMLNRNKPWPAPDRDWWSRIESSRIEVMTGEWVALEAGDATT